MSSGSDIVQVIEDEASSFGIDLDAIETVEERESGTELRILETDGETEADQVGFPITVPEKGANNPMFRDRLRGGFEKLSEIVETSETTSSSDGFTDVSEEMGSPDTPGDISDAVTEIDDDDDGDDDAFTDVSDWKGPGSVGSGDTSPSTSTNSSPDELSPDELSRSKSASADKQISLNVQMDERSRGALLRELEDELEDVLDDVEDINDLQDRLDDIEERISTIESGLESMIAGFGDE